MKEVKYLLEKLTAALELKLSDPLIRLSLRELEVCRLIREGSRSREIARKLGISLKTVEHHRDNIRRKLKISNRKVNLAAFLRLQCPESPPPAAGIPA